MFRILSSVDKKGNVLVFDDLDGTLEYVSALNVKALQAQGYSFKIDTGVGDFVKNIHGQALVKTLEPVKDDRLVRYKSIFSLLSLYKEDVNPYCWIECKVAFFLWWTFDLFFVHNGDVIDLYWIATPVNESYLVCSGYIPDFFANLRLKKYDGYAHISVAKVTANTSTIQCSCRYFKQSTISVKFIEEDNKIRIVRNF